MTHLSLTAEQRTQLRYWAPALVSGVIAWLAFMLIGHTPLIRSLGLTAVIIGMTMTLRPMGPVLAITGGLALAFSPAFWIQTGGAERLNPLEVFGGALAAGVVALAALRMSKNHFAAAAVGVAIFAALFMLFFGTPRSLRLTTLMTAWLFYLLTEGLLLSNPRADEPPVGHFGARHRIGLLLILVIGVLNDPLFALLTPAVLLGLFLSKTRLSAIYWLVLGVVTIIGARGIIVLYADSGWWSFPAEQAKAIGLQVPFILADGWREPARWIDLAYLVVSQYTIFGMILGVLGLARLARWYPPIGVVTMVAYSAYAIFGLVYFGGDAAVLLLPLLMIQIMWMTYAISTFGQWLQKSVQAAGGAVRWLAPAAYMLLPLSLLLKIVGVV